MITTLAIVWILGSYMAGRWMAQTGGPTTKTKSCLAYFTIVAVWPAWVFVILLSELLGLLLRVTVWRG